MSDNQTMDDDSSSAAAAASSSPSPSAAAASVVTATGASPAAAAAGKGGKGKGAKRKIEEATTEVDPQYEGQRFKLGELIYANYAEGKQWFEAKVLKVEKRGGLIYFYLHYQGWTDKYNDWRPYHSDSELHKHDEEGKRLMDEAKLKMKEANKKNKAGGAAAEESSGKSGKKKRVSVDDDTVSDEVTVGGASGEVKLKISGHLKKQLINDWEQVTRSHKLVSLPRPITVKMLLSEFEQSKTKQETSHQMVKEVVAGVEQYFEKALGTVLLYRFERPQFKQQQAKLEGKSLSEVYGAEHLLRLFVKLPSLLAYTKLEPKEAIVLGSKINDLIKWLDKKAASGGLFQEQYEAQDQAYTQLTLEDDSAAAQ